MTQKPYNAKKIQPLDGRQTLYRLVMQRVIQQMAQGKLKPGQYLPSEWDLAAQWQVSQGTVRKGLNELVARGILQRQQGIGTLVTHKNWDWGDFPVQALPQNSVRVEDARWPVVEILSVTTDSADAETAQQLDVRLSDAVWKIAALWRNGYQVVALDEAFLPMQWLPELNIRFAQRRGSFYAFLLQEYQLLVESAAQWLWLQHWQPEQQRLLKSSQDMGWCWARLSVAESGMPIEWRRRFLNFDNLALQLQGRQRA